MDDLETDPWCAVLRSTHIGGKSSAAGQGSGHSTAQAESDPAALSALAAVAGRGGQIN